jgi:hypothetical protein
MRLVAMLAAALATAAPAAATAQALPVQGTTQLLIDDHLIEHRSGLERVQSRPDAGRVVLSNDMPWEQRVFYPEVVRAPDGRLLMFYNAGLTSAPMLNVVSVAESHDGIAFTKRKYGYFSEGGLATNILFRNAHGPGIAYDPEALADARWKMAYFEGHKTTAVAFAGADLRFSPSPANPLATFKADTKQGIVWDPATRKWLWFTRIWESPRDGRRGWSHFGGEIRSVARFESEDFVHWSGPETVLRRTAGDPELSDFYGLSVVIRHGVMIGLLWVSDWADDRGRIGRQRAELVVSRDSGRTWTRVDAKSPFFDLGAAGGFDSEIAWPSSILTIGEREFIYYLGANRAHGVDRIEAFPADKYRIGVRTIGRDRFAGLAAGATPGSLTTKPLRTAGSSLRVNATVAQGGELKLWWVDAADRPLTSVRTIGPGDRFAARVRWSSREMSQVSKAPARLRITARDATLYGIDFR